VTRTRQIPRSEVPANVLPVYERLFGDRDPVAEPGTSTGTAGNWWTVFAQAPDLLDHMGAGFDLFFSTDRELAPAVRELAITRAGFLVGSQFVFSQHCKAARHHGLAAELVDAIPAWAVADVWTPLQRAVLAYTDEMVLGHGRVQDATFDALRPELSEVALIELTYAIVTYQAHATMCRALRLEYDDIDERVVEVAAPGGGDLDVMGAIAVRVEKDPV
jgi:alkylhydroperoxidase family enzyme